MTTDAAPGGGSSGADSGNGSSGASGEDAGSAWWWLVAVLAAAVLAAAALALRARRRARWEEQVESARAEARWFAEDLLPQLQGTRSGAELAGGWQVGAPRVASVEDQLTGLAASASGEERRNRALALRDAVRSARTAVEGVVARGGPGTVADDLRTAASELSEALTAGATP